MKALAAPIALGAGLALLLAGCTDAVPDTSAPSAAPEPGATTAAPSLPPSPPPSPPPSTAPLPDDMAVLENRDCAAVVAGYALAVQRKATTFASLFWLPDAQGKAAFDGRVQGMASPRLTPGAMTQEGAAGSLFCTVAVTLADTAAPAAEPVTATLVLRRVNDVDGATPQQLRWTIRSVELGPNDPSAY